MTRRPDRQVPVIAVVDDEQDIITFLSMALEDEGFAVVATSEPNDAMELLASAEPDLIFLDILMPRHTGVSLYAEIVNHPRIRDRPVVILSGIAVGEELPALLQRAGDVPAPASFIEKPIDLDELLRTVNALLGRPTGVAP